MVGVTRALRLGGKPLPLVDRARLYACGITPYDVTHLGHASTFVWVDVLGRVLGHLGHEPLVTRNVTDVDEVLTAAASGRASPTHVRRGHAVPLRARHGDPARTAPDARARGHAPTSRRSSRSPRA